MTPTNDLEAGFRKAARIIPGALYQRTTSGHVIHLPVPHLNVRAPFAPNGAAPIALTLWRAGKSRRWAFLPTLGHRSTSAGLRIVGVVEDLVGQELGTVAPARERGTRREARAGLWLTYGDMALARSVAEDRNMTLAGLIRRGLYLAITEGAAPNEGRNRSALRILAAALPCDRGTDYKAVAEDGGAEAVEHALREALFRTRNGRGSAALLKVYDVVDQSPPFG